MALFLYRVLGYLAMPVVLLRLLWRGRKNPAYLKHIPERFGFYQTKPQPTRRLWVHAVSVGEANAAIPVVRKLREIYTEHTIVVSGTTPTGRQILQSAFDQNSLEKQPVFVVYLPFDNYGATKRFIRHFSPETGVIMETELWPNLIDIAKQNNCKLLVANLRLSAKSARGYARLPWLTRPMLEKIDAFAVQYASDAERLTTLGANPHKISVTGNLKFDQQPSPNAQEKAATLKAAFGDKLVWVAGSTHAGEDDIVLSAFTEARKTFPNLVLVLAPRHPERFLQVAELVTDHGFQIARRSQWSADMPARIDSEVLLLDSVGELSAFIAASQVAFVGGSLVPVGGHNILEACMAGVPVIFGTHMHNFFSIAEMVVSGGAGTQVNNQAELVDALLAYLAAPEAAGKLGRALIDANQGALEQTLQAIKDLGTAP